MIRLIMRLYFLIRFGTVTSRIIESVNSTPCEIAYYDRRGREIGYWAYGNYHPRMPYRGQDL